MCDSCNALNINGINCHETGCPDSWKDAATGEPMPVDCQWCGCDFIPESKHQEFCGESCAESYYL